MLGVCIAVFGWAKAPVGRHDKREFGNLLIRVGSYSAVCMVAVGWLQTLVPFQHRVTETKIFVSTVSIASVIASLFLLKRYLLPVPKKFAWVSANPSKLMLAVVCVALTTLYFVVDIYALLRIPVVGWDVIDFWAPAAIAHVDPNHLLGGPETFSGHPLTMSALSAPLVFSSWGTLGGGFHIIFAASLISLFLLAFGYCLTAVEDYSVAFLVALVPFSMPLMQNHVFAFGYAEIPLILATHIGFIFLGRAIATGSYYDFCYGLLSCGLCMAIKDSGIIYAGALLLAFLLTVLWAATRLTTVQKLLVTLTPIILLAVIGPEPWTVNTPLGKLGWDLGSGKVWIAGKRLAFFLPAFEKILENLAHALFNNMSFSISTVSLLIFFIFLPGHEVTAEEKFLYSVFAMFFVGLILMQFSTYGFTRGRPDNDTSVSRAICVFMSLYVYAVPLAIRRVQNYRSVEA